MTVPRALLLLCAVAALADGSVGEAVAYVAVAVLLWVIRPDPPRWWVPWGGPWRY